MAKRATYQQQGKKKAQYGSPYNAAYGNPTINPFALQPFQYGLPVYTPAPAAPTFTPAPTATPAAPTAPRTASAVALAKLDPFYAASNPQTPTLLQPPAATGTAPIYSAGGGAPGQAASADRGPIPWAGTPQGQAAQVAQWQQAVSGYTNSAGTPIPGIPNMSFLDWYYQLGGRIQPGMSQGEANYIAAREAPYARLRARIARAGVRRQEPVTSTPTSESVPGESLRYAPPPTNWRIG